jgi:hypothetical protein
MRLSRQALRELSQLKSESGRLHAVKSESGRLHAVKGHEPSLTEAAHGSASIATGPRS